MRKIVCVLLALVLLTGCGANSGGDPAATGDTTVPTESQTQAPTQEQTLPWTEITEPVTLPGFTIGGTEAAGESLDFANPGCARIPYEGNRSYVKYVTGVEQLPDGEALAGYDAEFFENRALVVVCETVSSGSVRLEITGITVDGENAFVTVKRSVSGEVGTSDMATWLLWAEVDQGLAYNWQIENGSALPGGEKY